MTGLVEARAMMTTTNRGSVIDRVVEVARCHLPSGKGRHRERQHDSPQSEDDLNLAKKMEQFGADARGCTATASVDLVVAVLNPVGQRRETIGRERMKDGECKDAGRDDVERLDTEVHPLTLSENARRLPTLGSGYQ